jgi:anti-sigma-K factor RskA
VEQRGTHELSAAYALDALDADERRRFEEHLSRCPECREELASFREVAGALAYGVEGPPPPPALRDRILVQARSERANVIPLRRRWTVPVAATAAAVAACAAIAVGIWAWSLSNDLDEQREAVTDQARLISVISHPEAERIPVPNGSGQLVVTPSGEAALLLHGLGQAPEDMTYEAWVMQDDGAVPAGTFKGSEGSTAFVLTHTVPKGAVVGVSIEPDGGSTEPGEDIVFTTRAV